VTFSIRTLLAVIVLWAFYATALTYQNVMWTMAAINVAIAILVGGTLGVWLGEFHRRFWIPFCFVGWLYLAVAFTPSTMNRLGDYLPSTHLALAITSDMQDGRSLLDSRIASRARLTVGEWMAFQTSRAGALEAVAAAARFADSLHALTALVFGTLTGILTCILLRHKPHSATKATATTMNSVRDKDHLISASVSSDAPGIDGAAAERDDQSE
jgi:hypothetical protein